jgi:hypothetical protein
MTQEFTYKKPLTPQEELILVLRVIRLWLSRELTASELCSIRTSFHIIRPPIKEHKHRR